MMLDFKKVFFFGAHTDDEMICAGTLHQLVRQGCEVHVVTFSPAAIQQDRIGSGDSCPIVLKEWNRSLDIIGILPQHRSYFGMVPSADLELRAQEICQHVYNFCEAEKPDAAFVLSPEDENTAHAVVGRECERVMRGRVSCVIRCLFPWNHGYPNLFVELSAKDWRSKREVINCYASQRFRYDYEGMLARYAEADGLSVNRGPCERFQVLRWVI